MKPFDIELAKAGHPVCTRDGKPVRIICYNRKNTKYHIMALIDKGDSEDIVSYIRQGTFYSHGKEHKNDLFMAAVKKEGWVNVFINASYFDSKTAGTIYPTKEEALKDIDTISPHYIDTVKIEWEE